MFFKIIVSVLPLTRSFRSIISNRIFTDYCKAAPNERNFQENARLKLKIKVTPREGFSEQLGLRKKNVHP